MKNKYMEEREQEMLSLYMMMFFDKRAGGVLKLSLQPFFLEEKIFHTGTVQTVADRFV